MKKLLLASVMFAGAFSLAGCADVQTLWTDLTNGSSSSTVSAALAQVASDIDADSTALATDGAEAACAVDGVVYTYAKALETAGLIPNTTQINNDISVLYSLYTNPLCTAAIAGQPVTNPLTIIADIGTAVAAIKADTSGKVSATTAVSSSSTSSLRHKLVAKIVRGKMIKQ